VQASPGRVRSRLWRSLGGVPRRAVRTAGVKWWPLQSVTEGANASGASSTHPKTSQLLRKLRVPRSRYEIGKSVYRSGNGIQNRNVRCIPTLHMRAFLRLQSGRDAAKWGSRATRGPSDRDSWWCRLHEWSAGDLALQAGEDWGDPSAPLDTASGLKSTDSLPPFDSPQGGERVAPRSQGGGEAGAARRSSLFRPPASPVGTGGLYLPARTTTARSDTVESSSDANTPLGARLSYLSGRPDGASWAAAGEWEPRSRTKPAVGSSGRAPRGSVGGLVSVGPALQDAIAEVVRSEFARSLPLTPALARSPRMRPDPRWSGQIQSRRRLHYSSQSSDGECSVGDSSHGYRQRRTTRDAAQRVPVPRRTCSERRPEKVVRIVPEKIAVNTPNYRDLFACETYAVQNNSVSFTRKHTDSMGQLNKDVTHEIFRAPLRLDRWSTAEDIPILSQVLQGLRRQ